MMYLISNQLTISVGGKFRAYPFITFIEWFESKLRRYIGFDTETAGNYLLSMQLGNPSTQFMFDWHSLYPHEQQYILDKILMNKDIIKIAQNAKFDIKIMWHNGLDIVSVYCTMIAEMLIYAGYPDGMIGYSLLKLVKRYCNYDLNKSVRGDIVKYGFTDEVVIYGCEDVKFLHKIAKTQVQTLRKRNMASADVLDINTCLGLENLFLLPLAHMEFVGVLPDVNKLAEIHTHVSEQLTQAKQALSDFVINHPALTSFTEVVGKGDLFTGSIEPATVCTVNWNHPASVLGLLRRFITDLPDTRKETIAKYKHIEIFSKLAKYRNLYKMQTSFTATLPGHINSKTGRIHPQFRQVISTGRMSCSKPNMQQIPARGENAEIMRSCFIAPEGYKVVGGDFSQCELRILAEKSNSPVWIDIFQSGKDLHSVLAAATFGIREEDAKTPSGIKDGWTYRDIQKTINYMLAYGGSEFKLAAVMEIPVEQAKIIIDKFFAAVPRVQAWLNKVAAFAQKNGYMQTPRPYLRRRSWLGYKHKSNTAGMAAIGRAAKNHPMQGGNADLTKLATVMLWQEIRWGEFYGKVELCLIVHDEIQTYCKEEYAEAWASKMEELMCEAGNKIYNILPMPATAKIGDNWGETH